MSIILKTIYGSGLWIRPHRFVISVQANMKLKHIVTFFALTLVTVPGHADIDISALLVKPDDEIQRLLGKAQTGDVVAQYKLAGLYESAPDSSRDYQQAAFWYQQAAELGHPEAAENLGLMYNEGRGRPQDYAKAFEWFEKSAQAGSAQGKYSLALAYYHGQGTARDFTAAYHWYRESAAMGYARAMNNLGIMHGLGEGVAQDDIEAYAWFQLAAEHGNPNAVKNRDLTGQELSPEQLEQAQARAKQITGELGLGG